MTGRVAYAGSDHQVHVVGVDGRDDRVLTAPLEESKWGVSSGSASTWPTWSPDGQWIACFHVHGGEDVGGQAAVSVVQTSGIEERHLVELDGRQPVYLCWHLQGHRLAVLSQAEDELELGTCNPEEVGAYRVVEQGLPLFFAWDPMGSGLLVHAGGRARSSSRIVFREPELPVEDVVFPGDPGSFCAPLFATADSTVVGYWRDQETQLVLADRVGTVQRELGRFRGLVGAVLSPSSALLAVGASARGQTTPYDGVDVMRLKGGPPVRVLDEPCVAFFWTPDDRRLVFATVDLAHQCMRWKIVDLGSGSIVDLGRFWPTREQLFYLQFFEQYAQSHRNITSDGRRLVYAGHRDPRRHGSLGPGLILVLDLDAPGEPEILGEGTFAGVTWG